MALNITDADTYINAYCLDIEDWADCAEAKKQRIVNVASRTLTAKYPTYTIPDNAVYEFANVLATVYNDTNRMARQGVTSFTVSGTTSFTFKDTSITGPDADASKWIPQTALDLISAENGGVTIGKRRVGWSVL